MPLLLFGSGSGGVFAISGITRDSRGLPLGNCVVHLFRTVDDIEVAETTSNGNGQYSFTISDNTSDHYLVAYKSDTVDSTGATKNNIRAV